MVTANSPVVPTLREEHHHENQDEQLPLGGLKTRSSLSSLISSPSASPSPATASTTAEQPLPTTDDRTVLVVRLNFASYNTHLFGKSFAAWLPKSTYHDDLRAATLGKRLQDDLPVDVIGFQELFDVRYLDRFSELAGWGSHYHTRDLLTVEELRKLKTLGNNPSHPATFVVTDKRSSPARNDESLTTLHEAGIAPGAIDIEFHTTEKNAAKRASDSASTNCPDAYRIQEVPSSSAVAKSRSFSSTFSGEKLLQDATIQAGSAALGCRVARADMKVYQETLLGAAGGVAVSPAISCGRALLKVCPTRKRQGAHEHGEPKQCRNNYRASAPAVVEEHQLPFERLPEPGQIAIVSSSSTGCGSTEDAQRVANGASLFRSGDAENLHYQSQSAWCPPITPSIEFAGKKVIELKDHESSCSSSSTVAVGLDESRADCHAGVCFIASQMASCSSAPASSCTAGLYARKLNLLNPSARSTTASSDSSLASTKGDDSSSDDEAERMQRSFSAFRSIRDTSAPSATTTASTGVTRRAKMSSRANANACGWSPAPAILEDEDHPHLDDGKSKHRARSRAVAAIGIAERERCDAGTSKFETFPAAPVVSLSPATTNTKATSCGGIEMTSSTHTGQLASAGYQAAAVVVANEDEDFGVVPCETTRAADCKEESSPSSPRRNVAAAPSSSEDKQLPNVDLPFRSMKDLDVFGRYEPSDLSGLQKWFRSHCSLRDGLFLLSKYPTRHGLTVALEATGGLESVVRRGVQAAYVEVGRGRNKNTAGQGELEGQLRRNFSGDDVQNHHVKNAKNEIPAPSPKSDAAASRGFCVFNLHAHYGGSLHEVKTRMKNILQLREIVDEYRELVQQLEPGYDGEAFVILGDLNIIHNSETYFFLRNTFPECGDADCSGELSSNPSENGLIRKFEPWHHDHAKLDYVLYSSKHFRHVRSEVRKDLRFAVPGRDVGAQDVDVRAATQQVASGNAVSDANRSCSSGGERDETSISGSSTSGSTTTGGSDEHNFPSGSSSCGQTSTSGRDATGTLLSDDHISDHYMVTAQLEFSCIC
ncbi:unnamed protein product [Amoebophrya sp. A120]|nr:unnamed protein product [Amoebophrya sp. A120]|eukprot:GSA120T00018372001.1